MAEIKAYVQPQRLYRYRNFRNEEPQKLERELRAIKEGHLFCSAYTNLNDPMEGLFASSRALRAEEKYRAIKEAISNTKAGIGICSFSEIHNHELMWAHYAGQFEGMCIAYRLSGLLKMPPYISFVRMYYDEKVPTIHRSRKDPALLALTVLSYKNYRWLYEREWRMFARPGLIAYSEISTVSHVYLGSRMNPEIQRRIEQELVPLGIKVSAMKIDKYTISFGKPKRRTVAAAAH